MSTVDAELRPCGQIFVCSAKSPVSFSYPWPGWLSDSMAALLRLGRLVSRALLPRWCSGIAAPMPGAARTARGTRPRVEPFDDARRAPLKHNGYWPRCKIRGRCSAVPLEVWPGHRRRAYVHYLRCGLLGSLLMSLPLAGDVGKYNDFRLMPMNAARRRPAASMRESAAGGIAFTVEFHYRVLYQIMPTTGKAA